MRLAWLLLALATSGAAEALTLGEVFSSVDRAYPLLARALQERALAEAGLLEAQGGFDLKLKSKADTKQFGFYKNRVFDAYAEQPLQTWGADVYGGYERGTGNFGSWEGDRLSLDLGEWRSGLRLPLMRDREIDERRANLRAAGVDLEIADQSIDKQRLSIYKFAAKSYWEWVAAGRLRQVAIDILNLATERNSNLEETIAEGLVAPIELTDNRRAILQRQAALVSAERQLQGAAIELSLFLRDDAGNPVVPADDRLPDFPEPVQLDQDRLLEDIERAASQRPELRGLLAKYRQLTIGRELAENQIKPQIDLIAEFSRDAGDGSITKTGNELKAGVAFELPWQRRKERGKLAAQDAKLSAISFELQFTRDRVTADVQDAALGVRAAFDRLQLVRDELEAARQLEQAERDRFDLGDSTLFVVNLREVATANAAAGVVKALADYQKAFVDYRGATADLLSGTP